MQMIGIYKIESPSKRIYIGQSIDLLKRKNQYEKGYGVKGQTLLYRSIIKYGWDNHIFDIIEECDIDELNIKERYWQDYYDCINGGLNCKLTTCKTKSGKLNEETKEKIRQTAINNFIKEAGCGPERGVRKILYQYDLNGNFIKEWRGLLATSRELKIQRTQLNRSVLGAFKKHNAGGYYWSYIKI